MYACKTKDNDDRMSRFEKTMIARYLSFSKRKAPCGFFNKSSRKEDTEVRFSINSSRGAIDKLSNEKI